MEQCEQQQQQGDEFPVLSNESLRAAVQLWRTDRAQATAEYGPIEQWNTSQVTSMQELLENYKTFNEDISAWNTSRDLTSCLHVV